MFSQIISFNGGFKPNNLKGTHFGAKADIFQKGKWLFGINYNMVNYKDIFSRLNIIQPNLHIENKRDETFIDLPDLKRGIPLQFNEVDYRPRDLSHRFSIFVGCQIVENRNFRIVLYGGPHLSLNRSVLYSIIKIHAPIVVNEGDELIYLPYHDFQVYRFWDIGIGSRIDVEYKILQNISIGINSQMFFDAIGEGIDLMVGGVVTYNFNKEI